MSVVPGVVSFCGAVDHHLGMLALGLNEPEAAVDHLVAAVEAHERLGASRWARASRDLLEHAQPGSRVAVGSLVRAGKVWRLTWRGVETHVPDLEGMSDLAILLQRRSEEVGASELYAASTAGAALMNASRGDAAVDAAARAAYRARLAELDRDLADAEADHDLGRADRVTLERVALIDELRRNFDVKGRPRRLGDIGERSPFGVTAQPSCPGGPTWIRRGSKRDLSRARRAGFSHVRRAAATPFNLILEARR